MGKNGDGSPRQPRHVQKLRTFLDAWLTNGNNASEAARSVCLPDATPAYRAKVGSTLLAEARAEGYLEHELGKARHKMGVDEVLERLSNQAAVDMADFVRLTPTGFEVDLASAIENGKGPLIKELYHDAETGAPRIKLHDAQAALNTLAKIHGLFSDAPPAAPPAQVNVALVLAQLSPSALAELVSALRHGAAGANGNGGGE